MDVIIEKMGCKGRNPHEILQKLRRINAQNTMFPELLVMFGWVGCLGRRFCFDSLSSDSLTRTQKQNP